MHEVQREDLDAADYSREGTDYGSTNGEPTDTEEQVLHQGRREAQGSGKVYVPHIPGASLEHSGRTLASMCEALDLTPSVP